MKTVPWIAIPIFALLSACTTIPVDERAEIRDGINRDAGETIARMIEDDPEFKKRMEASAGHFVSRVSATKIPIVGGGYGLGVLHDKEDGSHTYMNITRTDLGAGLGAGRFRVVVLFENRETLEEFRGGVWKTGLGTESSAGTHSIGGQSVSGDGYSIHFLSDSGAALTLSARVVRLSVNEDLTGSAVSEVGIPNIGYDSVDDHGDSAPRIWDRKLPFLAQAVIDEGYDLPLPYGIGLVYANVEQAMLLDDLEVGINGRDEEPFEFVGFENAEAHSESLQLKLDAWLFPFMNVFALFGKVEGEAPMDVLLDGNDMLDHLGVECGTIPPDPLCVLLKDKVITLPITAPFTGETYGLGTTLAGGWNNWFVAIPGSVTYADMHGTSTEGLAITVTPRFGRVVNMGRKGNLSLFAGGNYLYADLTVVGTVAYEGLTIDYTVEQENKDPWNALVGFNWDINKHVSWAVEYNGFIGSRDAFITSVVWRL
jgi:hypothetical protein